MERKRLSAHCIITKTYAFLPCECQKVIKGQKYSDALLQVPLKLKRCKAHRAGRHPRICDIINDIKLFLTVYAVANF